MRCSGGTSRACTVPARTQTIASVTIRHAQPADYGRVIQHVNAWWGGREMAPMLPKLFFLHFEGTSFVAEDDDGRIVAFLIGFVSQTERRRGVHPFRGRRAGAAWLGRRARALRALLRRGERAWAAPSSAVSRRLRTTDSVAFHEALGFEVDRVAPDYDGPGEDRVLFLKPLG